MSIRAYRFANKLWADRFYDSDHKSTSLVKVLIFSILPWLIGLGAALLVDRGTNFIKTPIFYIGSLGIFVTTLSLIFASSRQYSVYGRFLDCFDLSEAERNDAIRVVLQRYSDFQRHLRAAVFIFLSGTLFVAFGFLWWPTVEPVSNLVGTPLPRFEAFSRYGWYDGAAAKTGLFIVSVYALFISMPLGTSFSILVRMPKFIWHLSARQPLLPPRLIKAHFSPAATFYSIVSILWLFGVLLMLYFLGINGDFVSLSAVAVLFALGLLIFTLPQIAYVRVVSASEDIYSDIIANRLTARRAQGATDQTRHEEAVENLQGMSNLSGLVQLLTHDQWVYPLHQTYMVIGAYIYSLISWDHILTIVEFAIK